MNRKSPFKKILIANRGEIARRVIRACREWGVGTVAVYADPDEKAPFVREADEAVSLTGVSATDTYLDAGKLIEAATQTGAQAVHPGYGFLSENASFAEAVVAAGLTWIGPSAHTIERMGSKAEARRLAEAAGVPVVPGVSAAGLDDARLLAEAKALGFPVLIKASAGGGGKGMRGVHDAGGFDDALEATRREARSAFGDDRLILEKYLENPRHIEIQLLGDAHGNLVHLFERECSIQRRHQKVVEETPSPVLDAALRERIAEAAVRLAKAVGYQGAGTVEFIYDEAQKHFFFLEMNTRLQVEHPVTEWVTGIDLVAWQLRVAAGEPLAFSQQEVSQRGHAIEVRLYAEDAVHQFAPQTGTLEVARWAQGPGIRWDLGVVEGDEVSPYFDPMLGKLAVLGATRADAVGRLQAALRDTVVLGVQTNLTFLQALVDHPAFLAGQTHTGFIEAHFADWTAPSPSDLDWLALAAFEVWGRRAAGAVAGAAAPDFDPWAQANGWRNI